MRRKRKLSRAGSPNVGRRLQDTETAYAREVAIIREKSCAAGCQCRHKLERIRRFDSRCSSQLRGGAQLITRNFCHADTATLREKCFIAPRQQIVSGTVGNERTKTSSKLTSSSP